MSDIELDDETYDEIIRLSGLYYRQAERCRESRAFLAGCVMVGAALEAMLLGFMDCYSDEAALSAEAPRRHGRTKPISDWSLAELLAVARERGWLPSGLSPDEDWDDAKADIGDYGEVVRQMRNLVHPARYAEDFPRKRITQRYLESVFEILDAASDHLLAKLGHSLRAAFEEEEE
jgi:hypothetical protein